MYLWIVLSIASMQRDGLEIESAIEVDRSDDISLRTGINLCSQERQQEYTHCNVGTIPLTP
jgi:hypothetical protein